LISKKTRQELREYFVGTTLAVIADEFDAADVDVDLEYLPPGLSGQRRTLVEQYYRTLDFSRWSDVRKFLGVCESVLHRLEEEIEHPVAYGRDVEYAKRDLSKLIKRLRRDGFDYREGHLVAVAGQDLALDGVTERFDLPELQRQTQRMRDAVESDPGLAIGTAKELVETTCKTILNERGIATPKDATIPGLVKLVRKELKLLPDDIPESARGSETIRRLLSNVGAVGQGVAELRMLYGTGHGKNGRHRGVPPRVARLAVGSAAALATFLLETHEERGR
jgi:hypothetical protein